MRGLKALSAIYSTRPFLQVAGKLVDNYVLHDRRLRRAAAPVCQIFTFHRVNEDGDPFLPATPTSLFKRQMEYLARRFPIIGLESVVDGSAWRHPYSCAITFDDGYRDNYLNAFPILSALKIPATIFLATRYVEDGRLPWYDKVAVAFRVTARKRLDLSEWGGPNKSLESVRDRIALVEPTRMWLRTLSEDRRAAALAEMFHQLGVSSALDVNGQMLRWSDAQSMARCGVRFGAHTVTHPCLATLSGNRLRDEIWQSKTTIESRLQAHARFFAYPFGKESDISAEAKAAVAQAGFSAAVTTIWGFNSPTQDRLSLFRCTTWDSSDSLFALKLDWYRFTAATRCYA
jgi:peptidoglycan/xylan/chitin deacetylase (PgdA/CDA1 family)